MLAELIHRINPIKTHYFGFPSAQPNLQKQQILLISSKKIIIYKFNNTYISENIEYICEKINLNLYDFT